MRDVRIEPKKEGKGRTFHAVMLASVEADPIWSGGLSKSENMRPVWAMFAGSNQELQAFMANLTTGRLGLCSRVYGSYRPGKEDRIEFLRSARYQTIWQREEEGTVATIYQPDLFKMDPGMVDPSGIYFILLPSQEWFTAQTLDVTPLTRHLESCGYALDQEWVDNWGPVAYLFAAYLDRRTRCPLVADGRFYTQLMAACLQNKLASFAIKDHFSRDQEFGVHSLHNYHEMGLENVGLRKGLVFSSNHSDFERVLAQEVETFFRVTGGR